MTMGKSTKKEVASKQATGSEGMEMKDELQKLKYEDSTQAEATAAEQWAVAYVAQVGATKETMIDALSTLRAVVMAYDRKLQNVPATGSLGGDQIPEDLREWYEATVAVRNSYFATNADFACRLIERIAKAEAALAQKTRECEELQRAFDEERGYAERLMKTAQEKHAQVEQLGRQVAELGTLAFSYREFHYGVPSENGRKMCIRGDDRCDLCKRIDAALEDREDLKVASRARTR